MDLIHVTPQVMRVRGFEVTLVALLISDLFVYGLDMHLEVEIVSALIVAVKAFVVFVVLAVGLFITNLDFLVDPLDVAPEVFTECGLEVTLITTLFPYRGVDGPDVSPQVVIPRGAVFALGAPVFFLLLVDGLDMPLQRPRRGALEVAMRALLILRPGVHGLRVVD